MAFCPLCRDCGRGHHRGCARGDRDCVRGGRDCVRFFYMVVVIITMFSIGFTATFAASVSVSVIGMISIFQQI